MTCKFPKPHHLHRLLRKLWPVHGLDLLRGERGYHLTVTVNVLRLCTPLLPGAFGSPIPSQAGCLGPGNGIQPPHTTVLQVRLSSAQLVLVVLRTTLPLPNVILLLLGLGAIAAPSIAAAS